MAKLKAARRNKLPASEFGLHAANAKARATQQVKTGHLSSAAAERIRTKANRILGRG